MPRSTIAEARELVQGTDFPLLYTVNEVADLMRVNHKTILRLIDARRLEAYDVCPAAPSVRQRRRPFRRAETIVFPSRD
jgi:hypothetical protein